MSKDIPKGAMSAYQRWELNSFDAPSSAAGSETKEVLRPPSQETIELIKEEARQQGLAQGIAEGREQGLQEGRAAARNELQRLTLLVDSVSTSLSELDSVLAEDLLALSLEVANAMTHHALTIEPSIITRVIRDCLHELASIQKPATLFLNPTDAALVRAHMDAELSRDAWSIREDSTVSTGGCRIETGSNLIDATIESRWSRISANLGADTSWVSK